MIFCPDTRINFQGMSSNCSFINCSQNTVAHQEFSVADRIRDHSFTPPKDDLPGQIAGSKLGKRLEINQDQICRRIDYDLAEFIPVAEGLTGQSSVIINRHFLDIIAVPAARIAIDNFVEIISKFPLGPHAQ